MGRKYIRAIGLEGEWDREKLLDYLRRKHAVPLWNEEFGLYFKPRLFAKRTRKRVQQILQVNCKEDTEQLGRELWSTELIRC
jgi:hypothetical protein